MKDWIYSDWILEVIKQVAEDSRNSEKKYASWKTLEKVLVLEETARKRAMGQRRGKGFPLYWDMYQNVYNALVKIGVEFDCPKSMVESCANHLKEKGVDLPRLSELAKEMEAIDGHGESWGRSLAEREAAFGIPANPITDDDYKTEIKVDTNTLKPDERTMALVCDAIATRCRREVSPKQQAESNQHSSCEENDPFSVVLAILSGRSNGLESLSFLDDGVGPVDYELPKTADDLAKLVLDERLLSNAGLNEFEADGKDREISRLRRSSLDWFSSDGCHRFAVMVGKYRGIITTACDEDVLMSRTMKVLDAMARSSSRPDAVIGTKSLILRYANGDAARVLAATTLALVVGAEKCNYMSSIIR